MPPSSPVQPHMFCSQLFCLPFPLEEGTVGWRNEIAVMLRNTLFLPLLSPHTVPPLDYGALPWNTVLRELLQSGSFPHDAVLQNWSTMDPFHGAPLHWLQLPSGHIHLLWCGVLRGLQGGHLLHHGLLHVFQKNLRCGTCNTSTPSLFTDLAVCIVVSFTYSQSSQSQLLLWSIVYAFLNILSLRHHSVTDELSFYQWQVHLGAILNLLHPTCDYLLISFHRGHTCRAPPLPAARTLACKGNTEY